MKKFILVISTLLIQLGIVFSQEHSQFDVFPLMKDLHYTYNCLYRYESWSFSIKESVRQDSGRVEYIVIDSLTIGDSLIHWNIEQRRNITRYQLRFQIDTSYLIVDTIAISLFESKNGNHELISDGLIWSFPISYPDIKIYRYSDYASFIVSSTVWSAGERYIDSLWFSQESGLSHQIRRYDRVGVTQQFSILNIKLVGNPVLHARADLPIVEGYSLSQNYPNPFNPSTTIGYSISNESFVSIILYDCIGREIKVLENTHRQAGNYSISLNNQDLSSGIYYYQMRTGNFISTKKLVLLK